MLDIAAKPVVHGNGTQAAAPVERSPGEVFAAAVADAGTSGDLVVPFGIHLPVAFPLFASRPRYTVRHLLKTAAVQDAPASYVYEPPKGLLAPAGNRYAASPEAAFAPRIEQTELTDLTVSVPLPAGILDRPALLAPFVDFRVLVRLSATENDCLLHGSGDGAIVGLLALTGTRHTRTDLPLEAAVTSAAAAVEETGGSCDGIVAHPVVYWEMVRSGMLGRLAVAGIMVSRTRMIPKDLLLLGDYRAAATLLLPGVASLALRRGGSPDGSDAIEATSRVGLAIHLPQHLMTLTWDGHRA